jgi:selenocysteine lyase/cysteine desulfurase
MNKRQFLKTIGGLTITSPVFSNNFIKIVEKNKDILPEALAIDEDFWKIIRKDYKLNPDFINLENGYFCITPTPIKNAFIKNIEHINLLGSYYMRKMRFEENEKIRTKLAEIAGCETNEIIITRNTTEAIDTVISGYDWKPGDEAVMAEQDYGSMLDHFDLQSKRYGLVKKVISLPINPVNDEEIIDLYEKTITPKTRLLMVCHMVNITGQILPIKKICEMAHRHNVDVVVDGAHAFAHIDYKISDLGCDYYCSSLHKWLSVPLGTGFLHVKKEKIKNLWPIFGDNGYQDTDIRKLNHTGTPAVHTDITILNAIDYHSKIGIARKEARLRFLCNYWTQKVKDIPNVILNTPLSAARSCGIANVGLKNISPSKMAEILLKKYKIWTVAIDTANVHGCRITPNIYTTTNELDKFVQALIEMSISK